MDYLRVLRRRTSTGTLVRKPTSARAAARTSQPRPTSRVTPAPSTPTDWLAASAATAAVALQTRLPRLLAPAPARALAQTPKGLEATFTLLPLTPSNFNAPQRAPTLLFNTHLHFIRDDNRTFVETKSSACPSSMKGARVTHSMHQTYCSIFIMLSHTLFSLEPELCSAPTLLS
ncbi:hypothetical protein EXIGLDRAFT_728452 [Exidia glandulosa HHB12029]|uniref:Uncharacterized protein n=1 Tax=Exidia glandulosa HHB12029 TaxID=1314781 RepID=A0A165CXG4_EXIGL|nr:hypothetical protein EXIGLDRAFT_728452 [Exidia glandulosa HHB12029]